MDGDRLKQPLRNDRPIEELSTIYERGSDAAPGAQEGAADAADAADAALASAGVATADKDHPPLRMSPDLPVDALPRGTVVDRFFILDRLGAGGMGVVYRAYDPELDRKIALKVVRVGGALASRRERLLREAQALAKLSHPNVVPVFDVGALRNNLFVAMEYVEGQTLRAWLSEKPRSVAEILNVFTQAGRGLAAAHAAGVVHRDFKPENAMIGSDGRVRVLDFGLARSLEPKTGDEAPIDGGSEGATAVVGAWRSGASSDAGAGDAEAGEQVSGDSNKLAIPLTATGAVLGTPRYMAPEQHRGNPASAQSDQFAWAIALYEALYRVHPFGEPGLRLADRVVDGSVMPAPKGARVPAPLRAVLLRALSAEPEKRFPSMDALLTTLSHDPGTRRRRLVMGGAAATLCSAFALAVPFLYQSAADRCRGAAQRRWTDVWSPQQRETLAQAFAATGRPYAADVWRTIERSLEGYMRSWSAMHTDACEATDVHGEQSAEVLDLRMMCLDDAFNEARALIREYRRVDTALLDKAVDAVQSLTPLSTCADVRALVGMLPPPHAPETLKRIEQARQVLSEARAARLAGRPADAQKAVDAVTASVRSLAYPPLEAELEYLRGQLARDFDKPDEARPAFVAAIKAAEMGRHDEVRLKAATALILVKTPEPASLRESETWMDLAEALLVRTGNDPGLAGDIRMNEAEVRQLAGKLEEAKALYRSAIEAYTAAHGADSAEVAKAHVYLGTALVGEGHYVEALAQYDSAQPILEKLLGPHHPSVAQLLRYAGSALWALGRSDEAIEQCSRAMAITSAALGPESLAMAELHMCLAAAYQKKGERENTEAQYEHALALATKVAGADSLPVSLVLINFGSYYSSIGEHEKALDAAQRSAAIRTRLLGEDHPRALIPLNNIGGSLVSLGRYAEGLTYAERVIAIAEKKLDSDHPTMAYAREVKGNALRGLGRPQAALAELAKALAIVDKNSDATGSDVTDLLVEMGLCHLDMKTAEQALPLLTRAVELAKTAPAAKRAIAEVTLGRALVESGRDPAGGLGLVASGLATLKAMGTMRAEIAAAERWLSQHRASSGR